MDQAIDRHQRHLHEQVLHLVGVPEAWPVGKLEDVDNTDEPTAPERDPCGIRHEEQGR